MPSVRPTIYSDVAALAPNLRQADVEELKAHGHNPEYALSVGFLASKYCYTGIGDDGEPICMFGVVDHGDYGAIWLLGTDSIPSVTKTFLRETKRYLGLFQEKFDMLSNVVDSRNTVHCHWLKWCGFKAIRSVPINGIPFYEFVRIKTDV